jgi:phosphomannomutase/phosphoglucomutase
MSPSDAFKPCDVRGRYPEAVNERLFWAIGRALACRYPDPQSLLLAGDVRASTPPLLDALWDGLGRPQATVLSPLATPAAYFVGRELNADLTLIVTASHNPPAYNGLKLLASSGRPPSPEEWGDLQSATEALLDTSSGPTDVGTAPRAAVDPWLDQYCEALLRLCGPSGGLRVVVDPGNGSLCRVAASALRQAGHHVLEINAEPDGSFPARGPDPTAPGALAGLASAVVRAGADLGVAFDGDGDRVVFVDETGQVAPGDVAAGLLALEAIERAPRAPVILDVRASRTLASALEAQGARLAWSYPGHALIRAQLLEQGAAFGGEISGHYFFAELGGDDGLYAALRLARLVAEKGHLSALAAALPRGHTLNEVRLPFEGPADPVLDALEAAFPEAVADRRSAGLVLEWQGQWALVRPSITEPLLTVRGESSSPDGLRQLIAQLDGVLQRFGLTLI